MWKSSDLVLRVEEAISMKKTAQKTSSGFTLMEIMVVMVLLSILTVMGLGSFRSARTKSRDTRRKADISNITRALEAYYNDVGKYPADDGAGQIVGCNGSPDGTTAPSVCAWGGEWKDAPGTYYMILLPADPATGRQYYYDSDAAGSFFQLYTLLENNQDIDLARGGSNNVQYYSGTDCDGTLNILYCNYGRGSTNKALIEGHDLTDSPN